MVRPLTEGDLEAVREVHFRAFAELDRTSGNEVHEPTAEMVARQRARMRHFLTHDPDGSWLAEVDGTVVGVALALKRDGLWGLSLLAVDPAAQSKGIGRALLDAALGYAADAETAVILSSHDPRAIRRYAAAGFDLYPQVSARGHVEPSRLPRPDPRVRAGEASDAEFADEVDRTVRGASRGPDHAVLAAYSRMLVLDAGRSRGYGYVRPDGRVVAVAATDDDAATALLWQCLAEAGDNEAAVDHITGEQQWAVRVALAAGLRFSPWGPAFWRGRTPPRGYLPDGAYL